MDFRLIAVRLFPLRQITGTALTAKDGEQCVVAEGEENKVAHSVKGIKEQPVKVVDPEVADRDKQLVQRHKEAVNVPAQDSPSRKDDNVAVAEKLVQQLCKQDDHAPAQQLKGGVGTETENDPRHQYGGTGKLHAKPQPKSNGHQNDKGGDRLYIRQKLKPDPRGYVYGGKHPYYCNAVGCFHLRYPQICFVNGVKLNKKRGAPSTSIKNAQTSLASKLVIKML